MSATSLASEVANSALDTIAKALPKSLADRVPIGLVEQVFVWVVKEEKDAKELVTILQDNGFKNIKSDSKGTTITAIAEGGVSATTDDSSCFTATKYTDACSIKDDNDDCPSYFEQKLTGTGYTLTQCELLSDRKCSAGTCTK